MTMSDGTTISVTKSTWKRLAKAKIDGDYESFEAMLVDWLDSENPPERKKALKQNK